MQPKRIRAAIHGLVNRNKGDITGYNHELGFKQKYGYPRQARVHGPSFSTKCLLDIALFLEGSYTIDSLSIFSTGSWV